MENLSGLDIATLSVVLVPCLFFFYLHRKKSVTPIIFAYFLIFLLIISLEVVTFKTLTFKTILTYTTLSICFVCVNLLILDVKFKTTRIPKLLSTLTFTIYYIIPAIFLFYYINFDSPLNVDALHAIYQTNLAESYEYVMDFFSISAIVTVLLLPTFVYYFIWKSNFSMIVVPFKKKYLFSVLFLSLTLTFIGKHHLKLQKFIFVTIYQYKKEIALFQELAEKRKIDRSLIEANKFATGETYVIVIGESLNKNHMYLYGYPRKTTPYLSQLFENKNSNYLKFNNAYSNHTHTVPVLSLALTEAAQDRKKDYFHSVSIVELLNTAQFETTWISNQNLLGAWDNMTSLIAKNAHQLISLNKNFGESYEAAVFDNTLVQYLENTLAKPSFKNRVIFIHLMGNHSNYCKRYPTDFNVFTKTPELEEFGTKIHKDLELTKNINCYDNSVLYNDYVVSNLLAATQKQTGKVFFMYIADHSDDVIEQVGHNSSNFTFDMTQIPLITWFSEAYESAYPEKIKNLKKHTSTLFTNDRLYDTLVGITGVISPHYRPDLDLSSNQYSMYENTATTLHGLKQISDASNLFFWHKKNAKFLLMNGLANKVLPHRVNSIGKLLEIWNSGFRSFELDLVFDYNKDGHFTLGHNEGVMGYSLEAFLSVIDVNETIKIWFDIKNINENNATQVLEELNRLDQKFNFKNKVIIESGISKSVFAIFRENGWHTSFYLPTDTIKETLRHNNTQELQTLAQTISTQVMMQQVMAISFDDQLYPFVKNYLEKKLPENLVYHIWYGPKLDTPDFPSKLTELAFFKDRRVKTILSTFKSPFNL